jgi:hypothetical protein
MSEVDPGAQELLDAEYARALVMETYLATLDGLKDKNPVKALLERARDEAMSAMAALVRADPFKPEAIRDLQWQVQRYDDLCHWVGITLSAGEAAQEDLSAEQRAEYETLIRGEPEERD